MGKLTFGRRTALGLVGAGLAAPFIRPSFGQAAWPEQTTVPDSLKGSGEVRIATFGGTMQETQVKAYFEPFEKITGIKVRAFPGSDPTKVKVMVETGNVEWDMAQLSRGSIMNLMKTGDYFEKIDYDLIDSGVGPEYRFEYGLEMLVWAQVLGYRTGAVPVQLLTDREVTMTSVWNGRMAALQAAGVPAAINWNQGLLKRDAWGIPKGAKNKVNAMKFAAYSTMAIPQARIALGIPYGSVNAKSNEYIPAERLKVLPSAPDIKAQLVNYNYDWWIANREAVIPKFNKWLLS